MKKLFYKLSMIMAVAIAFVGCERDIVLDFTDSTAPSLKIVVSDVNGNPVSGAAVSLFNTLDGYITEQGALATATTDGSGEVVFDKATMGERGVFYFNVASGTLRNWTSNTSTGYMLLNDGQTVVSTTLDEVPASFIALTANTWLNTSYFYGGTVEQNAPCEADDVLTFLKDGTLLRAEGASACASVSIYQAPISAAGAPWSKWTVTDGGATLLIRDLDPFWDSGSCNSSDFSDVNACSSPDLTISGGTATLDYGGGYVAVITAN